MITLVDLIFVVLGVCAKESKSNSVIHNPLLLSSSSSD